jgi:hypothetical protein
MEAKRFELAGAGYTCDGRRPPYTWPDKRAARGELHDLARADAEHGMHARLDEEGEMGIGTQAPIRHEDVPWV